MVKSSRTADAACLVIPNRWTAIDTSVDAEIIIPLMRQLLLLLTVTLPGVFIFMFPPE